MAILLKHQPWNTDGLQPEADVNIDWNMWKHRQPPYNALDVGTRVILVSGGGPEVGLLTWEVEVVAVAKERYDSHEEAWRLLRSHIGAQRLEIAGLRRRDFFTDDYTLQAPPAGWLLAWAYKPRRELMLPRPEQVRFRPNGWYVADQIAIGGETAAPLQPGQGRMADPEQRRMVEREAMSHVEDWLVDNGYREIRDTSATRPYDFEIGPEHAPMLRVEVKGTTGAFGPVQVTAGEVMSARQGNVPTMLAIVHSIRLTLDGDTGEWQADGGQLWTSSPWSPSDQSLKPTTYVYDPRLESA
ncbi:protein NO VEIN domain-containing protein [Dactylosporangium sp. NPDC000521]|uniref:protein NO VEIN domain-containing protein n=1 Tax=Dactylosporangium sp. NPDC000521 TaxID=3363975 RepID=UPI00369167FE